MTRSPPHHRIHVTGAHRSGTTLISALMATCFDIDVVVPTEDRLRTPLPLTGLIVLSKCPDEADYAFRLLRFDSNLDVVYILRDPRDVIVSKYGSPDSPYFTNLRSWRQNRAKPSWLRHPRAHFVSYERLVTRPDEVQHELAASMPFLRTTGAFSGFSERAEEIARTRDLYWQKTMHSIRPPGPGSIGKWQQHPERVKGQMLRHGDVSDELIALGYERDNNWTSLLDGVTPDLTPSHIPEDESLEAKITREWRNLVGMGAYVLERRHQSRESAGRSSSPT